MQRLWTALALIVLVAAAGLLVRWRAGATPAGPGLASARPRPPAPVDPRGRGESESLFDARSPAGWEIDGPHRIEDGSLVLGGREVARATLSRPLAEGEQLDFDAFQEGPPGARLWVRPTLLDPQPPDPDFCKEYPHELDLSGFVDRRWHRVRIRSEHRGTNVEVAIDIRPDRGGPGLLGRSIHSLPARGGCRCQLMFEADPGATLWLRNVLVGKPTPVASAP